MVQLYAIAYSTATEVEFRVTDFELTKDTPPLI